MRMWGIQLFPELRKFNRRNYHISAILEIAISLKNERMRYPNLPGITIKRPSQISYPHRFAICHFAFLHFHSHSCLFLPTFFPKFRKTRLSQISWLRHLRNCHFVKKRAYQASQPSWYYGNSVVANIISPPFCNLPFDILTYPSPFLPFPSHILPGIPKNSTVANIMSPPF